MNPTPFPRHVLQEVLSLDGNNKCCDCSSVDTDWASVNHGTLLCLDCAGRHRGLGVHTSFVRSVHMDTWTREQVEYLRQGGNGQIRTFFAQHGIANSPLETLYHTTTASHYRNKLKQRVQLVLEGIAGDESRTQHSDTAPNQSYSNSSSQFLGTNFSSKHMRETNQQLSCSLSENSVVKEYDEYTFTEGPMGLTLSKDFRDHAIVLKVVPGGPAETKGIQVGDQVEGVMGKRLQNYDEIMHMIPYMPRPLQILFSRKISTLPTVEERKYDSSNIPHSDIKSNCVTPLIKLKTLKRCLSSSDKQRVRNLSDRDHDNLHSEQRDTFHCIGENLATELANEENSVSSCEHRNRDGNGNGCNGQSDTERGEHVNTFNEDSEKDIVDDETLDDEVEVEIGSKVYVLLDPAHIGSEDGAELENKSSSSCRIGFIERIYEDGTFEIVYEDGSKSDHISHEQLRVAIDNHDLVTSISVTGTSGRCFVSEYSSSGKTPDYEGAEDDNGFIDTDKDGVNISQWIKDGDSTNSKRQQFDFRVTFSSPPLGMTVARGQGGRAEIVKVVTGGYASDKGIYVGDCVIGVKDRWVEGYDDFMTILPAIEYPITLVIRRKQNDSPISPQFVAQFSASSWIMPSGNSSPTSFSTNENMKTERSSIIRDDSGGSKQQGSSSESVVKEDMIRLVTSQVDEMSTREERLNPLTEDELEVIFVEEGDLGLSLDERPGVYAQSVVSSIVPKGPAETLGVQIGYMVLGVNDEKYLSHTHVVSTLKNGKRPVKIRFRKV